MGAEKNFSTDGCGSGGGILILLLVTKRGFSAERGTPKWVVGAPYLKRRILVLLQKTVKSVREVRPHGRWGARPQPQSPWLGLQQCGFESKKIRCCRGQNKY